MTLPEIDHVSFLVQHAQTFFAGECGTMDQLQSACALLKSIEKDVFTFPIDLF